MPGQVDEQVGIPSEELVGDIGTPDANEMNLIRDLFIADEPLVENASFDSVLHPQELRMQFTDGIGESE